MLAFRPAAVTVVTTLTYVGLLVGLLYVHLSVPHQADLSNVGAGATTDLAEAWLDLETLTRHHHPYNSHDNDHVRAWLLTRIGQILDRNGASYKTLRGADAGGAPRPSLYADSSKQDGAVVPDHHRTEIRGDGTEKDGRLLPAVIFDDTVSNVTTVDAKGNSVYFEGNNIAVYIRGTEDPAGDWWTRPAKSYGKGGVLVNAHFDSVSTGFGATDAGMGVVSSLQLIRHFTSPGRGPPRRGIVVLLNNNEENGLWGARAFGNSPLLPFVTTFINLEGAGAGGRAIMFRSTDRQVAAAYAHSPHPFGSVVANDAFRLGAIRSSTDYTVLSETYGQRGIDVAFYAPRNLYHTREDSTRHTSPDSIAHMLSAAIATAEAMTAESSDSFNGPRADGSRDKAQSGVGSVGVWFDMFGRGFAVLGLRGLFAWSVVLLVCTPVLLAVVTVVLVRRDRYYLLSRGQRLRYDDQDELVSVAGWRGTFRFPLALAIVVAINGLVVLAMVRVNPLVTASSEYSVWAMMFSLTYLLFWILLKTADRVRPSALQRGYVHIWLFAISWILLVGSTAAADRYGVAAGYLFAFLHSAVFVGTLITLCDCFALPTKLAHAVDVLETRHLLADHDAHQAHGAFGPLPGRDDQDGNQNNNHDDDHEADENTPLRGARAGGSGSGSGSTSPRYGTTTFRTTIVDASRQSWAALLQDQDAHKPYGGEQAWSAALPSATWLLQFVMMAPIVIILFGQVGLFLGTSVAQTGSDGSMLALPYLISAAISIVLLLPLTPFIHRVTFHVPAVLAVVFAATLAYNMLAFPFSVSRPNKFGFRQDVDLGTNSSTVGIAGVEEYVRLFIDEVPSAASQRVRCGASSWPLGLSDCTYDGAAVLPDLSRANLTISRAGNTLTIDGGDTKICQLDFDEPLERAHVVGTPSQPDQRFYTTPEDGVRTLSLHRRDRSTPWLVDVRVKMKEGSLDGNGDGNGDGHDQEDATTVRGTLTCVWDDANTGGSIPALEEALHYMPAWASLTKTPAGLVRVHKKFELAENK